MPQEAIPVGVVEVTVATAPSDDQLRVIQTEETITAWVHPVTAEIACGSAALAVTLNWKKESRKL